MRWNSWTVLGDRAIPAAGGVSAAFALHGLCVTGGILGTAYSAGSAGPIPATCGAGAATMAGASAWLPPSLARTSEYG